MVIIINQQNTATKNLDENHQDIDESESQDKEN